jgi:enamine deaminase RidA (YjgF/YER057c/UK114 family)
MLFKRGLVNNRITKVRSRHAVKPRHRLSSCYVAVRTVPLPKKIRSIFMSKIKRIETDDFWADSTVIEAGNFVYTSYCMKNEGESIENQINGAIDVLEERLKKVGLTLESVVQMDCLFANIADLNALPDVLKKRFKGTYPARKAYETKFIREGIKFQIDAVAFKE